MPRQQQECALVFDVFAGDASDHCADDVEHRYVVVAGSFQSDDGSHYDVCVAVHCDEAAGRQGAEEIHFVGAEEIHFVDAAEIQFVDAGDFDSDRVVGRPHFSNVLGDPFGNVNLHHEDSALNVPVNVAVYVVPDFGSVGS
ncbi:MAG TPA: hypothetical protein VLH08_03130 [Acidobacteriota bacterium]|nr:hypothetical protein [Acidobacteriota bacterium]